MSWSVEPDDAIQNWLIVANLYLVKDYPSYHFLKFGQSCKPKYFNDSLMLDTLTFYVRLYY